MNFSPCVSYDVISDIYKLSFYSKESKENYENYPSYLKTYVREIPADFHPVAIETKKTLKPHKFEIFKEAVKKTREKGKLWIGIAFTIAKIVAAIGLCSLIITFIVNACKDDLATSYAKIGRIFIYSTYNFRRLYSENDYLNDRVAVLFGGCLLSAIPLFCTFIVFVQSALNDPLIAKYNKLKIKYDKTPEFYTHTIQFKRK